MRRSLIMVALIVSSPGFWNAWAEGQTLFNPLTGSLANTMIAFVIGEWQQADIYVARADGTISQLTNNTVRDSSPDWSPDGSKIAFASDRDGDSEIYVMSSDGTDPARLTHSAAIDEWPRWSPDGTKIVFASKRDGNWEIYVMNVDGTQQTRLTNNSELDMAPMWSPDGALIAFHSNRDDGLIGRIYAMDADGAQQTRLTALEGLYPRWSPDGARIAFHSRREGNWEVYVMDVDTINQTRLTYDPATDHDPAWSPDGTTITFSSDRSGEWEIYLMNADGANLRQLTNNPTATFGLVWSPFLVPPGGPPITVTMVPPVGQPIVPTAYALSQNTPNPFNPGTTITYFLPEPARVRLAIHDLQGREIRTLACGSQQSGRHTVTWDGLDQHGRDAASGVYLYRMATGSVVQTRKMLLTR